ncbi:MAG TPA: methyltransferase domain-containing protein [Pirellulaceae bacterium]|nr:methyltransferase domain-containing protein [Pirellulaceae bacterium]
MVAGLAVFVVATLLAWLRDWTNASWLILIAHFTLATVGLSLLLILFALQSTEPTRTKRRQFGLGTVLLAMSGLGMLLAGVAGIARLTRFDPAKMTGQGWIVLSILITLLLFLGIPLLMNVLELLVGLANRAIRMPAVRRLIQRPALRATGSGVVFDQTVMAAANSLAENDARSHRAAYIHGTAPSEQERLKLLNRLTNGPFVEFLKVHPGMRVLEVGSGLGILAAEVAAAADRVEVVGLERSSQQMAAAVQSPRVSYVQGDAHQLPFADGSFDLVYCRYLLEHVTDPERVLREMRRVTRAGGRVAAMENDISLVRLDPPCAGFDAVWSAFVDHQRRLGGDGLIGRRLFRLFRAAGFRQIELSVQPELHWYGSPGFAPWIENLAGNIKSGQQGLIESGLCSAEQIEHALTELAALASRDDASMSFVWNRVAALP